MSLIALNFSIQFNNNILGRFYFCCFSLPEWVDRVLNKSRDIMELFTAIKYESFTHTTPMKKIKGGFFIKEIFDRLKNRTLGATKPNNMILYFTHGHAVVNILNTLNVYEVTANEANVNVSDILNIYLQ